MHKGWVFKVCCLIIVLTGNNAPESIISKIKGREVKNRP